MFTGLVEEVGIVRKNIITRNYAELEILASTILNDIKIGDSISTNGICLTVKEIVSGGFKADVMPESMTKTNLGELKSGYRVNLERAMKSGDRFGGHIVSGHIDGIGILKSIKNDGNATWMEVETDEALLKYIVYKGSIALDGTSLTVAEVNEKSFKVSIIPLTGKETNLMDKRVGDTINIECDVIGKYVERLLMSSSFTDKSEHIYKKFEKKSEESAINTNFLKENGFL